MDDDVSKEHHGWTVCAVSEEKAERVRGEE